MRQINAMMVVTTENIPGTTIHEVLGIARGSTIRARHVGNDIIAGLKTLVGGEIEEYTKLMADAREEAIERMMRDAHRMGGNAIVNVRFTTSMVMQGSAEVLAYGTAVRVST